MKPIKFKEQNCTYAENQPTYMPLPALKNQSPAGEVISCWRLSLTERIKILFTGRIWLELLSFNKPLSPSSMTTKKSEVLKLINNPKT